MGLVRCFDNAMAIFYHFGVFSAVQEEDLQRFRRLMARQLLQVLDLYLMWIATSARSNISDSELLAELVEFWDFSYKKVCHVLTSTSVAPEPLA